MMHWKLFLLSLAALLLPHALGQNNHESCDFWADNDECDANPGYMLVNCKTACNRVKAAQSANNDDSTVFPSSFYDIKEKDINGNTVDFSSFRGKVIYVVNVASYCGYTETNYQLIQRLASKFSSDGLEILLFPCNQFGAQEPGSNSEISNFAKSKGFQGRIMSKGDVNGDKTRPTFKFLKAQTSKNYITWNFDGKFVVDKTGKPHYIDSNDVEAAVQKFLASPEL